MVPSKEAVRHYYVPEVSGGVISVIEVVCPVEVVKQSYEGVEVKEVRAFAEVRNFVEVLASERLEVRKEFVSPSIYCVSCSVFYV